MIWYFVHLSFVNVSMTTNITLGSSITFSLQNVVLPPAGRSASCN